jgi:transposase
MCSNAGRVEIYSSIQRRRRYSVDEKLRILQEASRPWITISYVTQQHGISPFLLFHLRRRMAEGGKEAIRVDEEAFGSSEVKPLKKHIRELERVLGKKTLENEILREAVKVAQKTEVAVAVITRRGFAVNTGADTLGVSRSQLHSRLREASRPRGRYQKTEDAEILTSI